MKVILTAFGDRLRSEVMEWPEAVGHDALIRIHWVRGEIAKSIKVGWEPDLEDPVDLPQLVTLAFQETGRTYEQEDGSLATEYELVEWEGGDVR